MARSEMATPMINMIAMAKNISRLLRAPSVILRLCSKDGMSDSRKSTNSTFWITAATRTPALVNGFDPKKAISPSMGAVVSVK